MSPSSELELIRKAQAGSQEAFTNLVRLFEVPLYRFMLVRSQNPHDAEDRCQQAFLNAYKYIGSYNQQWRFSTWLFRIALRTHRPAPPGQPFEDNEHQNPNNNDPLNHCIAHDDRQNLWLQAKKTLSQDQFDALWLHYVEEKTVKEVASIKDKGVSWAKVTLHRARQKLGHTLNHEESYEPI